jgi:hypothetical protein
MMYNCGFAAPVRPSIIMRRSILLAAFFISICDTQALRAQAPPAPADTTGAQTVIPRLANFTSLATILNLARGTVRILAVVSPTSPGADAGLEAITSILSEIPSKRLRAFVILSSSSEADTRARSLGFAAAHVDRRIVYVWDPEAAVNAALTSSEGLAGAPALDVLLLYDTAATFTTNAPAPVMWIPLGGDPVDAGPLRDRADAMVRAVEREASGATGGSE